MSDRYSRHELLSEIGSTGQEKLSKASVAVVGCGGLGNIAAAYLAGAGIGTLILIDGDTPDISNVHRQIFYTGAEPKTKAEVLCEKLKSLNPEVKYITHPTRLDKSNVAEYLEDADLVLECTDDQVCKYLVNDFCAIENIPLVYGAIYKFEGYVSVFKNASEKDVHLRDIFPQPDLKIPTCSEVGVLGTVAGFIGLLQANEALKYILQIGENLVGKLLTYDMLSNRQMSLKIKKAWTQDMEELFDSTAYTPQDCLVVPEKTIAELMDNRDAYQLVSVMVKEQHQAIDEDTLYIEPNDLDGLKNIARQKETIVYCRSGRVSRSMISKIISEHPSAKIYNLVDGLKGYQKFKVLS